MVATLNPIMQGWRNYYTAVDPGVSRRFLAKVDWQVVRRLILYWCKKYNRVIGFGRATSDGAFHAAIHDVVVHSDYQGSGVGRLIIGDLLHNLRDVPCVHLVSTTGTEGFYRLAGLKKVKTSMARYLNPALEKEYLE